MAAVSSSLPPVLEAADAGSVAAPVPTEKKLPAVVATGPVTSYDGGVDQAKATSLP